MRPLYPVPQKLHMKRSPIAKISRPKLAGAYPRKRLFKLLDGYRNTSVTWISSPAGSGKTTLIASYLDTRKLPCLWYQLDEGDDDPATFFYYLGLAAKNAAPRHKRPLPLLTPEYLANVRIFSRRYFENLCSRLKPPFALVFDNYHEVAQDSPFHEIFREGLASIPEGIRAVVISRTDPPPQFATFQAGNALRVIGWDTLRLMPEESRGIVRLEQRKKHPVEAVRRMHDKTQGWAAGLILMAKSKNLEEHVLALPGQSTPEGIFDYFASELFDAADGQVKNFLLKTAVLPQITIRIAEMLTADRQADRILSYLHLNNYFTDRRFRAELVYQYHPLFREFLLAKARETYSQTELAHIKLMAAEFLEIEGQVQDAAELFIETEDWEGITRLIGRHAQVMISQGRSRTLEHWLTCLPGELRDQSPWLRYWLGMCVLPLRPSDARNHFEQAFSMFTVENDPAGILLAWATIVETFPYEWNNFTPLDAWIDRFEELQRAGVTTPAPEIEAKVALSITTALMIRHPDHARLGDWIEKTLSLARTAEDAGFRMKAYSSVMNFYVWIGDTVNSRMVMGEIQKLAESPDASPLVILSWKWMEAGTYAWVMASPDRALQSVYEAIAYAEQTGVHIWTHMLFALGVNCALVLGDFPLGEELLQKMEATLHISRSHGYCHYHYLQGWYFYLKGELGHARTHSERALTIAVETGYVFPVILCELEVAQVLYQRGQAQDAAKHLARAFELSTETRSTLFQYTCFLTRAYMTLQQGRREKGVADLRRAMHLGREHGYVTPLWWWDAPVMTELCITSLHEGIEVAYVQDLIKRHNLEPGTSWIEIENWPWRYRIYALGGFELIKGDTPLRFSGKVQKKPLEMLKALIAFGGKDVTEDQLTEALWPDAEGDVAHTSFSTTLHRLRQLLGGEKILGLQEGRVSLDRSSCWVDVWAFEGLIRDVETEGGGERENRRKERKKELTSPRPHSPLRQQLMLPLKKPFLSTPATSSPAKTTSPGRSRCGSGCGASISVPWGSWELCMNSPANTPGQRKCTNGASRLMILPRSSTNG